ncbi:cupredoxin domain-containing protein [Alicyclobacillus ferrooxydans]|uniref:EfeO-type cupredoxin-like domain-containing protein n=1 Tax=Alicyclobacillus ferrooxydans TaxID=471514 RepID=A0A0P9GR70_9BACL|nr:cupredoxin domain-containing protein [Alicyclobacillus ferrooxydans]KPV43414.1 hypothetical protein AN477_12500 [Alicyclobacillus ferrooxydans]
MATGGTTEDMAIEEKKTKDVVIGEKRVVQISERHREPNREGNSIRHLKAARGILFSVGAAMWLLFTPLSAYAGVRQVNVQITDHGFSPSVILVALNRPVQIHVVNNGHQNHQFSIPYYRIFSSDLAPGGVTNIGFSPWTEGKFQMMSDPSGLDKPEFTGQFVVVEGK